MDGFNILDIIYSSSNDNAISYMTTVNDVNSIVWHARLGHIGQDRMNKLARDGLLAQLAKINLPTYEHCLARKSIRKLLGKAIRAMIPLQQVHPDIYGPMNKRARHRATYFITFIDAFTRYSHIYLISHKSEALECFRRFMNLVENQTEKNIKTLRTDHGR